MVNQIRFQRQSCGNCGSTFVQGYKPSGRLRKYCSLSCTNRVDSRSYRFRARATGLPGLHDIGQRDGWRCHICGRQVSKNLRYPDLRSASLDHLLPLRFGGSSSETNLGLAHLGCNIHRGSLGPAQLRLGTSDIPINVDNGKKTHCPNSHPYDGANVYWSTNGSGRRCRKCRKCSNQNTRNWLTRRKALVA